jgi:hypothetical protein
MSRISDDAPALSRSSSVKFMCTAVAHSFALRARRERPRGRHPAEQGDELA